MKIELSKTTGVNALGTSDGRAYDLKHLNEHAQGGFEFWQYPIYMYIIIFILSVADFASLYTIFSYILMQNPVFLWILTGVIALILVLIPVLLAKILHKRTLEPSTVPNWQPVLMIFVLVVMLVFIYWLRFNTKDMGFSYAGNLMTGIGGESAMTSAEASSPAAGPMVYILCFLPVCNSVISFFLTWISLDPIKQALLNRVKIFESLCELGAAEAEFTAYNGFLNRLIDEDRNKFAGALDEVQALRDYLMDYVRVRIAEHLGDPASASALCDPKRQEAALSILNRPFIMS